MLAWIVTHDDDEWRPLIVGVPGDREVDLKRIGGQLEPVQVEQAGPEDLATTVYHQLGIVADKELMSPGNRPIEIVDGGKVVKALLA